MSKTIKVVLVGALLLALSASMAVAQDGDDTVKDEARGDEDRLFGDAGDDFVDGRDGDRRDVLDCGSGRDVFARDNGDEVKKNCERPF
jgi:hypothetical protein